MECVRRNLGGLECLAGIPGTTGATPVQNVGAYGQEVAERITAVHAIDIDTLRPAHFSGGECGFHYRGSRFKEADAGKFVILEVDFSLPVTTRAVIRYPELARAIELDAAHAGTPPGAVTLEQARASVVRLRKGKGMVVDADDPDSRSAGSFFTNPLVTDQELAAICRRWADAGHDEPVPVFPAAGMNKIPAGWLVERAGFPRGLRRGGAGISTKHALALANYGGSTGELLALASDIQYGVLSVFNVKLEMEPVVAGAEPWRHRHE
jgi:UDP-N-acetylmuramate dehydrogenase